MIEVKAACKADEARELAKERWGDVKTTAKVLVHENGHFSVKVWHTFHSSPTDERCGRVVLKYDSSTRTYRERVAAVDTEEGLVYSEEELDI